MKKQATKSLKVLNFIDDSGKEGVTLTEIQHFIWTVIKHKSEKSFWKKDEYTKLRKTRGYWCDALYGTDSYDGILKRYCAKTSTKKWILVRYPNETENMYNTNY